MEGLKLKEAASAEEKALMLTLSGFNKMLTGAFEELAPHRICAYIYEAANEFNRFYHSTRILSETDREKQEGWIALLELTRRVFEECLFVLGMKAPEKM